MSGARAVRIVIEGRVQGVGFRAFVVREAARLNLRGSAVNLADGRVEVLAAGGADAVAALCEACGRGPYGSNVSRVDVTDADPSEITADGIRTL